MPRWTACPALGHFAYDGRAIARHWARLHTCDQEALPDNPAVLQAWTLFHNGQFEEAHHAGLRLGPAGFTVANRAACTYATLLESRQSTRLALCEKVAERCEAQIQRSPKEANAHFLLALALGQYSQGISVARALAQGLGSRIKTSLETAIALQPLHADAHFALGAFHAEIIDKVGALIANMTYGARKDISLRMFETGFALQPDSAAGLMEYAIALQILEDDAQLPQATALYAQAAALQAMDAREYLDIALAKSGLAV